MSRSRCHFNGLLSLEAEIGFSVCLNMKNLEILSQDVEK